MNGSTNLLDTMRNAPDIAEHKEVLAQRYAEEGLSRLELQIRRQSLIEQNEEARQEGLPEAQLYRIEMEMVEQFLIESAPPAPTPAELADELQNTNPLAAEALRHQLKVDGAKQDLEAAQARLDEAKENGWDSESPGFKQLAMRLEKAREAHALVSTELPPTFAREREAQQSLAKAEALRAASQELLDSPEAHLVTQGEELQREAADLANRATELRNYVPVHTGAN